MVQRKECARVDACVEAGGREETEFHPQYVAHVRNFGTVGFERCRF